MLGQEKIWINSGFCSGIFNRSPLPVAGFWKSSRAIAVPSGLRSGPQAMRASLWYFHPDPRSQESENPWGENAVPRGSRAKSGKLCPKGTAYCSMGIWLKIWFHKSEFSKYFYPGQKNSRFSLASDKGIVFFLPVKVDFLHILRENRLNEWKSCFFSTQGKKIQLRERMNECPVNF